MTAGETEVEDLTAFEWTPEVPCSYEDCAEEAVWLLMCPCGEGRETVCQKHYVVINAMRMLAPESVITFNLTCGHTPLLTECGWQPIKL